MKRMNLFLMALCILLILLKLPLATYASDTTEKLSTNLISKIEKYILENKEKGKIPGITVSIVKGNETIYQKCFGYADVEKQIKVDSASLFEIGSNSKAFTALGILALKKQGVIDLNDDIAKYIPWFKVIYEGKEVKITLAQLLQHTSGIPYNTIDQIPVTNNVNALEETVKTLIGARLDSYPGESFQYATINYDILGLVIEKVTGNSYEDYITNNIFKPLGLENTYFFIENQIDKMAVGYKMNMLNQHKYKAPVYRGNNPAAYIISCGNDMAKWLKIQLGTTKINYFYEELVQESHNLNYLGMGLSNVSYANGWFLYQNNGEEISHGGNNPNYSSFLLLRPKDEIGIAVLSNTNSQYTETIARGISVLMQGKKFNADITDLNITADKISFIIILVTSLCLIILVLFFITAVSEILKNQRKYSKIDRKHFLKIIFSLFFMCVLSYSIYLLPDLIYRGVSWKFISVWLPKSVIIALILVNFTIWLLYLYLVFIFIFKKKNHKNIFMILALSIVSGFGNSLVIFTINMAINSSNEIKIKLIVFFILGIIIYVYGQKIIRVKLIKITNEMVYQRRVEIINQLLRSSYKEFEDIEKGNILSTLNNDTETVSRFTNILISGITNSITLICCFFYLGYINFYALILAILILLFITSIYFFAGQHANKVGEEARDLQNIFFKFINDLVDGFKELSINKKKKIEFEADMKISCGKYRDKRGEASLAFANMFIIGELLFTIAIGMIALIFPLILKNLENLNVSSYVFILLYMTGPVHAILDTIPNSIEVRISIKRINQLLKQISTLNGNDECSLPNNKIYHIKLKLNQVEYEYDKNDGSFFRIGPVSYEFNSNEIIFITGGNGSGKSTLAKLLTGLYTPTKGTITLNNHEISSKSLSQYYSAVFSDYYLFDKLYGISYKNKLKEIQKYLRLLQLDKKVKIINGTFNTIKLSSGQKKRLGLLVAYLEDRPIYLFDEWAADQDPQFRHFFYNTLLLELKEKGKCIIAVTHDDQYFHLADKVIKMEMGKAMNDKEKGEE